MMSEPTTNQDPKVMSSRLIEKVVPATKRGITRLVGTVDIDGKGTDHPLPEVDPFILLDAGTIKKNKIPPFGAHPHRGHSVVTVLTKGKFDSWDSFRSKDSPKHIITAPASYWVDAGSGVFHEEQSVITDEDDPSQHCHLFQLWVGIKEEDRQKPPKIQYDNNLPVFDCQDPEGKVIGKRICHVGPETTIITPHPISVVHITRQDPRSTYRVPINPEYGGFVVHVAGQPSFGGTTPNEEYDVLVLGSRGDNESDYLEVKTTDAAGQYLVCTGEPHREKWAKKLVANGAIITATPEEARELAPHVEAMSIAGKAEGGFFAPFGMKEEES